MTDPSLPLDERAIRAALEARGVMARGAIVVARETGSTNDDAKALAREGADHGAIVVADAQSRGRGRSGSAWFSPPGENLYLSVVLVPGDGKIAPATFTLAAGLEVARAVDAALGRERAALVKWPNDVHVRGRKIAGILVEALTRGDRTASVVAGVGINVATEDFPPELASIATSLAREGARGLDRSSLAGVVAARLLSAWDLHERDGLSPFLEGLRTRDALLGRRVRVEGLTGVASGIETDGSLALAADDGVKRSVVSGHVEIV